MKRNTNESFEDYKFRRAKEQLLIKLIEQGRFKGTNIYAAQGWFNEKYDQLCRKFGRSI